MVRARFAMSSIARLSRARHLRVISRLSTTAFRDRETDIGKLCGRNFLRVMKEVEKVAQK